jgi:hypothetical protein
MPNQAGTLETIAQQFGLALQPLQSQLTPANIIPFLAELGLQFPPQLLQPSFVNSLNAAATAASALPNLLSQLATDITNDNEAGIVQDGIQLIQQIGNIISALQGIATELGNLAGTLPGMNAAEVGTFAGNLADNLLSYLVISYVENVQPGVVGVANLLGVLDYIPNPGVSGDPTHPSYVTRRLQLSSLGRLLTSPASFLQSLYTWGNSGFDGTQLIPRLGTSLDLLGIASVVAPGPPISLTASLLSIQANLGTNPPGLLATLKYSLPAAFDFTLPLSSTWSAQVQVQGTFAAGLQATITPPVGIALKPPTGTLTGQLQMNLIAQGPAANHPLIILGATGGSRLQANSFTFGAGLSAAWDAGSGTASASPLVQVQVAGGKAVIDMSKADGFLADVIGGTPIEANFDLKVTWQPDTGVHVSGGAQLEIDLPLHLTLGPITLPTLYLVGGIDNGDLTLEVSAALGVTLGPIQGSVDRVGAKGILSFPNGGGNLGPADLQIKFKPPNGLGLEIDAGFVVGGGYISFDPDHGQYSGVFQLILVDIVQVNIIGVLDTIMPDGSSGFSFLLIITFGFPPIQLGFGFTLDTVGGIGGVNRTMSVDALHAGFVAHTLSSVLSPQDPIANAPQIISDIRSFFPVAVGRYIFGPIVGIGWGTPTLIQLTLGVILEVPDPFRLVILGLIDAGLPTQDEALIELHIDVLGIVDFGAKTLSIDGSLYDSRVLIYSLAGDLALRLSWGDNPNFVFSLGGFNPHFNTNGLNVPANMQRMSVSIGDGDNPRISSNSYFAVTSNSLQFGANVEAYASAGGFSIHGYLGFDVLIIISPFSFEFDFSAGFDVAYNGTTLAGLNVDGVFSGPTPWHLHGDASITFLCFSVSASVDLTWGDSTQAVLPQKPVIPDLIAALQNPASWSAALPDGAATAVTLVTQNPADKTLRVHPMGTLQVREKVVPLDLPITKYGNATPSDGTEFAIPSVQINGQAENIQTFKDYFAAGQFLTLSDADKLSRPSFEKYDAGLNIGSSAITQGQDSHRPVTYQEHYIDEPTGFSRFSRLYYMPAGIHLALTAQGAGYASLIKNTGSSKYSSGPAQAAISVQEPQYVVTSVNDLSVRSDVLGSSTSYFQAKAALQTHLAAHPEESGQVQIMPVHEVTP